MSHRKAAKALAFFATTLAAGVMMFGAAGCGESAVTPVGDSAPPAKGTPGSSAPVGTLGGPPPGSPLNSSGGK